MQLSRTDRFFARKGEKHFTAKAWRVSAQLSRTDRFFARKGEKHLTAKAWRVSAQLSLIIAFVAWPALARAQVTDAEPGKGDAKGSFSMYADSDKTTVVTSVAEASVRLPQPVIVNAHALVDAVSSASVDVVSAATARFTENRIELGTNAQVGFSQSTEGTIGYTHSGENDWQSHAVELGLSRDLAKKNAKLTLGYGFTRNYVGRAHDPTFEKQLDVQGAQLGVSQVLGKKTLATLAYTLSYASGYQGSPYRFITVMNSFSAPESPPEQRTRHAVTGRLMQVLGDHDIVDAQYRVYADDWGILSHTAELAYTHELSREWSVRLRARGYHQNHASFYEESYEMPMRYMTVDRELSTFWDGMAGLKVAYLGESWDLDAKCDAIVYRFEDYARLRGRVAVVTGLGVTWRW
jgi:hypothetical protein